MIVTNDSDLGALADPTCRCGPNIALASDFFFLKDESWLRVSKLNDIAALKREGAIAWTRGWSINIEKAEQAGVPTIIGPDCLFFNSYEREREVKTIDRANLVGVLVLNQADLIGANVLRPRGFRGLVTRVRHFLRPALYQQPFEEHDEWDVLIYKKGVAKDSYFKELGKRLRITTLVNGQYTFDELVYKAQRSKLCIYDSQWESYGLAAQEIMACGCPIICNRTGIQEGNILEGKMGYYVDNGLPYFDGSWPSQVQQRKVMIGVDADEMTRAVETVLEWKKRDVYGTSMAFNDVAALRAQFHNAIECCVGRYGLVAR